MVDMPPLAARADDDRLRVSVAEETVSVGARTVETGRGVRIHKVVAEHPVAIDERLLKDAVEVRRVPVDRMVGPGEAPSVRYEGQTLVVPVLEEVLVVERRVRIKEELHITTVVQEVRHVETVVLRSEQASVERFDESDRPPAT
jgi:stress response protein YsnF